MKENHSRGEFNSLPRWITPLIEKAIKEHPVIVMTGIGKLGKIHFSVMRKQLKNGNISASMTTIF